MPTRKIGICNKKWVFLQEYEHCSCTFLSLKAGEFPARCLKHQNWARKVMKLPGKGFDHAEFGWGEAT